MDLRRSKPKASSLAAAGIEAERQVGLDQLGGRAAAEQEQGGRRVNHTQMFPVLGGGRMWTGGGGAQLGKGRAAGYVAAQAASQPGPGCGDRVNARRGGTEWPAQRQSKAHMERQVLAWFLKESERNYVDLGDAYLEAGV